MTARAGNHPSPEAAEDGYGGLFDFIPLACLALTRNGRIRQANAAASALLGASRRRLRGQPLADLIAPQSRRAFTHFLQTPGNASRRTGETWLLRPAAATGLLRAGCLTGPRHVGRGYWVALWPAPEARSEPPAPPARPPGSAFAAAVWPPAGPAPALEKQLRELRLQCLRLQERECARISRELGNRVAQTLVGMSLHLTTLGHAAAVIEPRDLSRRLGRLHRLLQRSVAAVQRSAHRLRPALLDELGLVPALRSHLTAFAGREKLRIRFSASAAVDALDALRRGVLYRVAQAALAEVGRRPQVRQASLRLWEFPGAVRLEVWGDGMDPANGHQARCTPAQRLAGVQGRLEMVGGRLEFTSDPANGATLTAEIPVAWRPHGTARAARPA